MREAKFQVLWVKHSCDFTKCIEKHYTTIDRLTNGLDKFDYLNAEVVAKRQYTGLKDKNGVETYKKDIVKCMENVADGHFVEVVVVVDFDFAGVNFNYATEFEVIGNIYENPELIKWEL